MVTGPLVWAFFQETCHHTMGPITISITISMYLQKDRILPFFDPPLPGQFLYPERGQKQTFFDPLLPPPPHLIHVVIEWPQTVYEILHKTYM